MRPLLWLALVGLAALGPSLAGCASAPPETAVPDTVVSVDLVRTFPGEQANYLRFIEMNWAPARAEVRRLGDVVAYEVLVREPTGDDWDVMLVTEYASREAFERREAVFGALFQQPEFAMKPVNGKSPRDMAEIIGGGDTRPVLRSR
ncbi:MAG: hypothetical protein AAGI52_08240 [Bacteroidota bacterium]